MRAAVSTSYGPPDVVRVVDAPAPVPATGEVLVAVRATTVNRTDCAYRAAKPFFMRGLTGLRRPKRKVLGTEFAGEVVQVGDQARKFVVGDRVFGYCEGRFGTHAQYLVIQENSSIARIPGGLEYTAAAAAMEGAHYARSAMRRAGVQAGHQVLVNGATGGIGSAAVQLLKASGATVTAVCQKRHFDLVQSLGADHLIDYTGTDFTHQPGQYDVVFDAVGKTTFARSRKILKSNGIYVSSELGPAGQNVPLAVVGLMLRRRRRVVFPLPEDNQSVAEEIRDHLASGAFRPVIDRKYSLDKIVEAYRYVETGTKIGNVVVTVPHDA